LRLAALNQEGEEMKNKLIAMVLALFVASEMVIAYAPAPVAVAAPARQRFTLGKGGTLLNVFNADGESVFGRIKHEGFAVKYKTPRTTRSSSAIENQILGLAGAAEQSQPERDSAGAVAKTRDGALQIATTIMVMGNTLVIARTFRNISARPVRITSVSSFVGRTLVNGSLENIEAGIVGPIKDCGGPAKCPVGPLCPTCPPCPMCPTSGSSYSSPWLLKKAGDVILRWPIPAKLAPARAKQSGGEFSVIIHVTFNRP
jgi:hypothetical protein